MQSQLRSTNPGRDSYVAAAKNLESRLSGHGDLGIKSAYRQWMTHGLTHNSSDTSARDERQNTVDGGSVQRWAGTYSQSTSSSTIDVCTGSEERDCHRRVEMGAEKFSLHGTFYA